MHTITREKFNLYKKGFSHAYRGNLADTSEKFSVTPNGEQKIIKGLQHDPHKFLSLINIEMPSNQIGEALTLKPNTTVAGRTKVGDGKKREPATVGTLSANKYLCSQVNFDTAISYSTLDAWAHKDNFNKLLNETIREQIARDLLMIGFNGVQVAENTNRETYPLLQDVGEGWLHKIKTRASKQKMDDVKIGTISGNTYTNVDAAVYDVANNLIPAFIPKDELVVITGNGMISHKYFNYFKHSQPVEAQATKELLKVETLGGFPVIEAPFFPEKTLLITSLKNLSIYFQRGSSRLSLRDEPEYDRITRYYSVNLDYVVENLEAAALITGIKFPNSAGDNWE